MDWLNYHHLLYFWTAAREGSIAAACRRLHLAQPTVSMQIRALERALGHKLLVRSGRGLALTEMGRMVYRYADEIFSLGRDLMDAVRGRPADRPLRLLVGITDAMHKLLARQLIEPALHLPEALQIVCLEDEPASLLARLAQHDLDLVLADAPVTPAMGIRAFNHLLGRSGVTIFGTPAAVERYRPGFPRSLDGAPMLLPITSATMRRSLDLWFEALNLRPVIVGEFQDSALMKAFGQTGLGLFPAATVIARQIQRQYGVRPVGEVPGIREEFYAISMQRKLTHPAVLVITRSAREHLLAP